eukprot:GHVU01175662.1.p1 GENE.GHVU01175662.1~~GHVU01175662.1.p1  ORF type:complete len:151 (+),score=25.47 GHVU01175662.1:48-500(+)
MMPGVRTTTSSVASSLSGYGDREMKEGGLCPCDSPAASKAANRHRPRNDLLDSERQVRRRVRFCRPELAFAFALLLLPLSLLHIPLPHVSPPAPHPPAPHPPAHPPSARHDPHVPPYVPPIVPHSAPHVPPPPHSLPLPPPLSPPPHPTL